MLSQTFPQTKNYYYLLSNIHVLSLIVVLTVGTPRLSDGCASKSIAAVWEEESYGVKYTDFLGGLHRYITDQEWRLSGSTTVTERLQL